MTATLDEILKAHSLEQRTRIFADAGISLQHNAGTAKAASMSDTTSIHQAGSIEH